MAPHGDVDQPADAAPAAPAPPAAPDVTPPPYRLYLPRHVALGAAIAGPLGGAIPLMINLRRLGRRAAGWWTLGLLGLFGSVVVFGPTALTATSGASDRVQSTLVLLFCYELTRLLFRRDYRAHFARAGRTSAWWSAAAWGLLALAGVMLMLALPASASDIAFAVAQRRYAAGDYQGALSAYNWVPRSHPNYSAARYNRGLAYEALEQWDDAAAEFTVAMRGPLRVDALIARARCLAQMDRTEFALSDLARALAARPHDPDILTTRAGVRGTCDDVAGVIDDCTHALQTAPNHLRALQLRAWAYQFDQQLEKAASDLRRAAALAPGDQWTRDTLRQVQQELAGRALVPRNG